MHPLSPIPPGPLPPGPPLPPILIPIPLTALTPTFPPFHPRQRPPHLIPPLQTILKPLLPLFILPVPVPIPVSIPLSSWSESDRASLPGLLCTLHLLLLHALLLGERFWAVRGDQGFEVAAGEPAGGGKGRGALVERDEFHLQRKRNGRGSSVQPRKADRKNAEGEQAGKEGQLTSLA